ncbi:MAG: methyltransferase domain-containing protein [Elusimicrobia bacterium]|nr:methyltransferase domain-containing protein [Elusimicrobiota bacterium]
MMELKDSSVLHSPELFHFEREGIHFFVDGSAPNWVATDDRGAALIGWVDGRRGLGEIRRLYEGRFGMEVGRAFGDLHSFFGEVLRRQILFPRRPKPFSYSGREAHLSLEGLREFWLHVVQTCNLSCTHCLVSSGPQGERGPDTAFYENILDQAQALGARRFYFTGGEPFIRQDLPALIRGITEGKDSEVICLTNATLFDGSRLEALKRLDRARVRFQVSLDGTSPEINDPIRGEGVFLKACEGLRRLNSLGFETSLTAVVTRQNLRDLENLPALAKRLGAVSVHLMWLHKRGRILETEGEKAFPSQGELLELFRCVYRKSVELDIVLDNAESFRRRVNGPPGVKYDLGNLCWESACLYTDGALYPSAATAGTPALRLGDLRRSALEEIWRESPVARAFRQASVAKVPSLDRDPFRFLTGGGDMEHAYFFSQNGKEGNLLQKDPYYGLYVEAMKDLMAELALRKKRGLNQRSGFNPPRVYCAMGEDAVTCSEEAQEWLSDGKLPEVRTLHSNCVLSFDVEKPYRILREFYGHAAVEPQKELCCPIRYSEEEVGHIPKEVLERFYGCGSPVPEAQIQIGETVLDLGSGAGIDCFIAAKRVGRQGRVIGVDMTSQMLKVARESQKKVAGKLGYDVVEFREGYLERVPAEDKSVDLVTSNCVINLSPDKGKVFSEVWRILRDGGRMVVADIVSDRPVPISLQAHRELWGECISGALSEAEFLSALEKAGFYGISILKKSSWKEVQGYSFSSITVCGFKFEKRSGCSFLGHRAIYRGPYRAVLDEEGHLFPRGEAVEICTDTAEKLKASVYGGQFSILQPDGTEKATLPTAVCVPSGDGKGCC